MLRIEIGNKGRTVSYGRTHLKIRRYLCVHYLFRVIRSRFELFTLAVDAYFCKESVSYGLFLPFRTEKMPSDPPNFFLKEHFFEDLVSS
jgi:hypothetical protein